MMSRDINLKQQRFIENYLKSGNATDALIKSGYKCKHPDRYAYQLLNKPQIKLKIEKTREEMSKNSKLTFAFKLEVLHKGINHYVSISEYDKAAKLIEVSNKMQGHNAPERSISSINVNDDLDTIRQLTEEYLFERKAHYGH